ncbi:hypothetical protein [Bacillus sp. B15-48]|uniref:hypothetical protein n=1 Tax=Bacillus sp. B15-48 TaxID=1548601 RepID=UPI00193F7068|nr:hypothetical protein [Bacillus sp. B15-48]MBM4761367.1 hypothetical protein [Bacillus sp. B15-48]
MDLSYLVLLLCPLMLIFMFFIMKGMHGKNGHSEQHKSDAIELKKNMEKLMEQNEILAKEIESMKRNR